MSAQQYANANEKYVAGFTQGDLALPPSKHTIVVTCMDARIDPAASLGINLGEAHVIRNAGGRATDALRSILVSQQLLGTKEIVLYHHTGCGMLTFHDEDIRAKLGNTPEAQGIAFLPFGDLEQSVKDDVKYLKEHPLVLKESKISGWIYEVETGRVKQVA
ncbi:carbonic anhydrase [Calocera viscosa TUFC12733]|uniref:Carbonic anhydrase n=1 Tax=Calocera viscosa (strain TUFC12733) TaxID=1330018 RepID=A0A167SE14_CALVF|nr:carbonic anhydrase [Calocera viscosa TUFC12733]